MKKELKTQVEVEAFVAPLVDAGKYIVDIRAKPGDDGFVVQWQEHKTYTAQDGKVFPDEIWMTEEGQILQVQDIEPDHCRNILRRLLRRDRNTAVTLEGLTEAVMNRVSEEYGFDLDDEQEPAVTDIRILH